MTEQITNVKKLIIISGFLLFFIKYLIPITKNTICAIKNGIVNISLNTPIIVKSNL